MYFTMNYIDYIQYSFLNYYDLQDDKFCLKLLLLIFNYKV